MTAVLGLVFWLTRVEPDDEQFGFVINLVLADVSVVLLCLILMLGPAARFWPRVRPFVPWGRELGIAMFLTASLHVFILGGWDILGFFYEDLYIPGSQVLRTDWGSAVNWVGLFALLYALVLTATSNDWSHRQLGRGWKFLQRQTYTLFVLTWLHTAGWFLAYSTVPTWFWVITAMAVIGQFAGYVHTVRATRGPSPQRVPAGPQRSGSGLILFGKWVAVFALWGGFTVTSLALADIELDEMAIFCDRYEEVQDLPQTEMVTDLLDYLPETDQIVPIPELIEECLAR